MRDPSLDKPHVHPARYATGVIHERSLSDVPYAELAVTSNFTFLTGASHPDEFVQTAALLGYRAIALTDTQTLAGVVRAHSAAKQVGLPFIVGSRLLFTDPAELSVLVYPTDLQSYGRLCELLTLGKRRAPKGQCHLTLHELIERQEGMLAVAVPPRVIGESAVEMMEGLRQVFDRDRLSIAAAVSYSQGDAQSLRRIADVAAHLGVPLVAINDAQYHVAERRLLHDVVNCIRLGCTLDAAGTRLLPNAERHLKSPAEMARLFADYPQAIARTIEIAERCRGFTLDQLRYQYPSEVVPPGMTPMQHLVELTWQSSAARYPSGVPEKVKRQIEHELALIEELDFPHYFLTVHDIVSFARSRGIICQGRGAAANSAVCFCLGITSVDPERIDVLFERFVSRERKEPPDIDIDLEHERR